MAARQLIEVDHRLPAQVSATARNKAVPSFTASSLVKETVKH
jgi:hypothetical protein